MLNKIILFAISVSVSLTGCNENSSRLGKSKILERNISLKDKNTENIVKGYLEIEALLIRSDSVGSAYAAKSLSFYLDSLKTFPEILTSTRQIEYSKTLSAQRKVFSSLSNQLVSRVEKAGVEKGVVYLQYCPMANDGDGAYWISGNSEIRNPYFGDSMLECGEVKRKISSR